MLRQFFLESFFNRELKKISNDRNVILFSYIGLFPSNTTCTKNSPKKIVATFWRLLYVVHCAEMLHVKDDDRAMGMSMTLGGPQCHLQIQFEKTEEEFVHNVPYCIITSQLCTGTNCNLKSAQSKPKMVVIVMVWLNRIHF